MVETKLDKYKNVKTLMETIEKQSLEDSLERKETMKDEELSEFKIGAETNVRSFRDENTEKTNEFNDSLAVCNEKTNDNVANTAVESLEKQVEDSAGLLERMENRAAAVIQDDEQKVDYAELNKISRTIDHLGVKTKSVARPETPEFHASATPAEPIIEEISLSHEDPEKSASTTARKIDNSTGYLKRLFTADDKKPNARAIHKQLMQTEPVLESSDSHNCFTDAKAASQPHLSKISYKTPQKTEELSTEEFLEEYIRKAKSSKKPNATASKSDFSRQSNNATTTLQHKKRIDISIEEDQIIVKSSGSIAKQDIGHQANQPHKTSESRYRNDRELENIIKNSLLIKTREEMEEYFHSVQSIRSDKQEMTKGADSLKGQKTKADDEIEQYLKQMILHSESSGTEIEGTTKTTPTKKQGTKLETPSFGSSKEDHNFSFS